MVGRLAIFVVAQAQITLPYSYITLTDFNGFPTTQMPEEVKRTGPASLKKR